jgi:hypothetical protein
MTHQHDGRLLRALYQQYPDGHFDEINVGIDAARSPKLLTALTFLDPKIDQRHRSLSRRSQTVVAKWIERIEGRTIGGLLLTRDRIGWCQVVVDPTGPQ